MNTKADAYEIPEPLGELPTLYVDISEDHVNGGSVSSTSTLDIPQGKLVSTGQIVDIIAIYNISMTVDDWGSLSIDGERVIDMTKESGGAEPGPQGGHEEWTKTAQVRLSSGPHIVSYEASNIEMKNAYYNKFVCEISMDGYWQWESFRQAQTKS